MINQKDSSMFYGISLTKNIHNIHSSHSFICIHAFIYSRIHLFIAEINAMLVALHLCTNRFICYIYLFVKVICYLYLLVI